MKQKIIILDFGSQYTQLIARRVRELNTYCEILPYNRYVHSEHEGVIGIILSGSPFSVNDPEAPCPDLGELRGHLPMLGICYGAQYLTHSSGGTVAQSDSREYGKAKLVSHDNEDMLVHGISEESVVWMSHGDTITKLPDSFRCIASTSDVKYAAYKIDGEQTWGVQFHPEVYHSQEGMTLLGNFVNKICGSNGNWTPASFVQSTVKQLQDKLGNDNVVMALSGGVDSTVAAVLMSKAIGKRLFCIFVDNGLLRKNEFDSVLQSYNDMGLNIVGVDAKKYFLERLSGITDPEKKRKIIGASFIDIFDQESKKLSNVKWLAQGTIYPDVIESLSITGTTIKSHHNVGGLPERMSLKLVEPLRLLFKDEVRRVGRELGIPQSLIGRRPFPGPGLGVRILGEVTAEKVRILQEADYLYINALHREGLYEKIWQAGAVLLPIRSVGVMGDERTYEYVVALRAVNSTDGMTATASLLPMEFLTNLSTEIIGKVKGVNRVVYDISSKPPATIEWE